MRVLVAGGAGYIGSITSALLAKEGYEVTIIDSLIKGYYEAVPDKAKFYKCDISESKILTEILHRRKIEAVLHFAAFIEVGESFKSPEIYFDNNVVKAKTFLDTLIKEGVNIFVFSSTAAVYGEPERLPIIEEHPTLPTNPYGHSKLAFEKILESYSIAYGLKYISLRYFNASGAAFGLGESHRPETHLIPLTLQVPLGKREAINIFGVDYDTFDGTCIRDYIHVQDLAKAHIITLEHLKASGKSDIFNLGNGQGFSVREVIKTCEKVVGHPIKTIEAARRPGDPARLIASSEKIKNVLNWKSEITDLERIVSDAWQWHSTHPDGYAK